MSDRLTELFSSAPLRKRWQRGEEQGNELESRDSQDGEITPSIPVDGAVIELRARLEELKRHPDIDALKLEGDPQHVIIEHLLSLLNVDSEEQEIDFEEVHNFVEELDELLAVNLLTSRRPNAW